MRFREPRYPVRKSNCNKHEAKIRLFIYRWLKNGRPSSLTRAAWGAAHEVFQTDGHVFIDFNEHHQRMYLRDGYLDWFKNLVDETAEQIKKEKEFATI